VQVGVSIGVAVFPDDGDGFDDLLRTADGRMYDAKRGARAGAVRAGAGAP
jgi:GGDEF domain-containing protein